KVIKIDPATMATVAAWVGAAGETDLRDVSFAGSFIFVSLYLVPAKVIKIDPATMATVAAWVGGAGQEYAVPLLEIGVVRIDHLPLMGVH
ncbi:MAG: hypothetical protein AAB721_01770, partial [Patescibacteria group bacterium]